MLAGLAFLARTLKYFFTKYGIGSQSEGDITNDSMSDKELVEKELGSKVESNKNIP